MEVMKEAAIGQFEVSPESLSQPVETTKNIKIKQYLSVRQELPRTRLKNTILYENFSQKRQLDMALAKLKVSKHRHGSSLDQTVRTFVTVHNRKQSQWRRDDEVCLAGMNLPIIIGSEQERPKSMTVMYHLPKYKSKTVGEKTDSDADDQQNLPLMPVRLTREKTEIVIHKDKTFLNKLPEMIEVNSKVLERQNTFCGKSFLERGEPSKDGRFQRLHSFLQPAFLTEKDMYPAENLRSRNRLSKYRLPVEDYENIEESALINTKVKKVNNNFLITQRETSNMSDTESVKPEVTMEKAHKHKRPKLKRSTDILESFKSKDVHQLATKVKEKSKMKGKLKKGNDSKRKKGETKSGNEILEENETEITNHGSDQETMPRDDTQKG